MDIKVNETQCEDCTLQSVTLSIVLYGSGLGVIVGFAIGYVVTLILHKHGTLQSSLRFVRSPILSHHYQRVFVSTADVFQNTRLARRLLHLPHLHKFFILDFLKVAFELLLMLSFMDVLTIRGPLAVWIAYTLVHLVYIIIVGILSKRNEDFSRSCRLVFRVGMVYIVVFCSPLLLAGAAYSLQTTIPWYEVLNTDNLARYLLVALVLGSSMCLSFLILIALYAICERVTMQRRVTMRFRWVMGVAGIHVVCALASFSFYYNLKWITLALTPLAAELVALSLALLLTSLLIEEHKRYLGDTISLLHGAVTLLTAGLLQDYHSYYKSYHPIFAVQVIQVVSTSICISVTVCSDIMLIKDLLDTEALALRHRRAGTVISADKPNDTSNRILHNTMKSLRNKLHSRDNEITCCICLDVFEMSSVLGVARSCGHHFHIDCINEWMKSHSTCPVCREYIVLTGGGLRTMSYHDLKKIINKTVGRPVSHLCSIPSIIREEPHSGAVLTHDTMDDVLTENFESAEAQAADDASSAASTVDADSVSVGLNSETEINENTDMQTANVPYDLQSTEETNRDDVASDSDSSLTETAADIPSVENNEVSQADSQPEVLLSPCLLRGNDIQKSFDDDITLDLPSTSENSENNDINSSTLPLIPHIVPNVHIINHGGMARTLSDDSLGCPDNSAARPQRNTNTNNSQTKVHIMVGNLVTNYNRNSFSDDIAPDYSDTDTYSPSLSDNENNMSDCDGSTEKICKRNW